MKSFFISLLLIISIYSQSNPLKQPQNIKLFADYLFCEQDYLRAAEEYISLKDTYLSDTIIYKIAKCYSIIGEFDKSLNYFFNIPASSVFYDNVKREIGKIYFLNEDEISLNKMMVEKENSFNDLLKLKIALKLLKNQTDDIENLLTYDDEDFITLRKFYSQRKNPDYKSETVAGILSAIIPGSGKIYTEEYSDGITAFILTGIFSYLAYDNLKHEHNFRGYLFTGIAAGFYFGNIYGSVASAQIFNAKVDFSFLRSLSEFLIMRNYFVKEYEFCN
jgi:TM2 domain-containing membrane protein YozV